MKRDVLDLAGAASVGGVNDLNKNRGRVRPVSRADLSATEKKELAQAEAVIQHGLTTFREVGEALLHIRDHKLYRATHKTFEAYCRERWQFSKTHANRLIGAKVSSDALIEAGANPNQLSEGLVRPLVGLSPARVKKVWDRAQKRAGDKPPTARLVAEMVNPRAASAKGRGSVEKRVEVKAVVDFIKASFKANPGWDVAISEVLIAGVRKL